MWLRGGDRRVGVRDGLEKWFTTSDLIRPDLHSSQRAYDQIVESGDASAVSHRKTGPAWEPKHV